METVPGSILFAMALETERRIAAERSRKCWRIASVDIDLLEFPNNYLPSYINLAPTLHLSKASAPRGSF